MAFSVMPFETARLLMSVFVPMLYVLMIGSVAGRRWARFFGSSGWRYWRRSLYDRCLHGLFSNGFPLVVVLNAN